jgi:hypothetical protein
MPITSRTRHADQARLRALAPVLFICAEQREETPIPEPVPSGLAVGSAGGSEHQPAEGGLGQH